nr:MAG: hypothetical protein [Cressdnaviricota sp.]
MGVFNPPAYGIKARRPRRLVSNKTLWRIDSIKSKLRTLTVTRRLPPGLTVCAVQLRTQLNPQYSTVLVSQLQTNKQTKAQGHGRTRLWLKPRSQPCPYYYHYAQSDLRS